MADWFETSFRPTDSRPSGPGPSRGTCRRSRAGWRPFPARCSASRRRPSGPRPDRHQAGRQHDIQPQPRRVADRQADPVLSLPMNDDAEAIRPRSLQEIDRLGDHRGWWRGFSRPRPVARPTGPIDGNLPGKSCPGRRRPSITRQGDGGSVSWRPSFRAGLNQMTGPTRPSVGRYSRPRASPLRQTTQPRKIFDTPCRPPPDLDGRPIPTRAPGVGMTRVSDPDE